MIKNMYNIMFTVYLELVRLDNRIFFLILVQSLSLVQIKKKKSHNHQSTSKLAGKVYIYF